MSSDIITDNDVLQLGFIFFTVDSGKIDTSVPCGWDKLNISNQHDSVFTDFNNDIKIDDYSPSYEGMYLAYFAIVMAINSSSYFIYSLKWQKRIK